MRQSQGLHFFENPCAMMIDCPDADLELGGDCLARISLGHESKNGPLSDRQSSKPVENRLPFGGLRIPLRCALQCPPDRLDQEVVAYRLLDEVEGTVLYRADRHRNIPMTGQENDRNGDS